MRVQTRVKGPHPGVRLAHRSYGILHRARPYWSTPGSNGAGAVALGVQLEKRDGVALGETPGIDADAGTEGLPEIPGGGGAGAPLSRAAQGRGCLESAPIMIALISDGRVSIFQETACEYVELKCVSRAVSDKDHSQLASSATTFTGPGM